VTSTSDRLKRSVLAQERSRETRRSLVRAALELWNERGYEEGFDRTTAEEIAARAGVAKTTFYFHFRRKDDLLLEAPWLTAGLLYDDAVAALAGTGRPGDDGFAAGGVEGLLAGLLTGLAHRIEKSPRAALRRMLAAQPERGTGAPDRATDPERFGFERAFLTVFTAAAEKGELPPPVPGRALAEMLTAIVMDTIRQWAQGNDVGLRERLTLASGVLVAGARHLPPTRWPGSSPDRPPEGSAL
jgi:AcrR family transcriptional regulator